MTALKIVHAFVLLCGICTAFPDIYSCTFEKYYCNSRICTTMFYKELQRDSSAVCKVHYHLAAGCVGKILYECVGNLMPKNKTSGILDFLINEKILCDDGPLATMGNPKLSHPDVNLTCNSTYDQKAALCGKTVREKFVTNPSDSSLCSEYAAAKKCIKDLLSPYCTFNSKDQEVFDFQLDDYNPFCADNRDPGATGSAHCSGFQSPVSTTTVSKTIPPCSKSDVIFVNQFILILLLGMYPAIF